MVFDGFFHHCGLPFQVYYFPFDASRAEACGEVEQHVVRCEGFVDACRRLAVAVHFVYGHEDFAQGLEMQQEVVDGELDVVADLSYGCYQRHAVGTAEGVVGHDYGVAFLGDPLLPRNLHFDGVALECSFGECGPLLVAEVVDVTVYLIHMQKPFQHPHNPSWGFDVFGCQDFVEVDGLFCYHVAVIPKKTCKVI